MTWQALNPSCQKYIKIHLRLGVPEGFLFLCTQTRVQNLCAYIFSKYPSPFYKRLFKKYLSYLYIRKSQPSQSLIVVVRKNTSMEIVRNSEGSIIDRKSDTYKTTKQTTFFSACGRLLSVGQHYRNKRLVSQMTDIVDCVHTILWHDKCNVTGAPQKKEKMKTVIVIIIIIVIYHLLSVFFVEYKNPSSLFFLDWLDKDKFGLHIIFSISP